MQKLLLGDEGYITRAKWRSLLAEHSRTEQREAAKGSKVEKPILLVGVAEPCGKSRAEAMLRDHCELRPGFPTGHDLHSDFA